MVFFLRTQIVKSSKWPSISAAISNFVVLFNLEININNKPTNTYIPQSKFKSERRQPHNLVCFLRTQLAKLLIYPNNAQYGDVIPIPRYNDTTFRYTDVLWRRWHACIVCFLRTQIVKSSKWPSISAAISHFVVLFNLEINIYTKRTKIILNLNLYALGRRRVTFVVCCLHTHS